MDEEHVYRVAAGIDANDFVLIYEKQHTCGKAEAAWESFYQAIMRRRYRWIELRKDADLLDSDRAIAKLLGSNRFIYPLDIDEFSSNGLLDEIKKEGGKGDTSNSDRNDTPNTTSD